MQQILDSFVELTGIRAAYFDATETTRWGMESQTFFADQSGSVSSISIVGKDKPLCEFCESLRFLKNQEYNCMQSDKAAFKMAEETAKPYIYKCHMGLYEAVIPIFIKNRLTAYLMLGQVVNSEELQSQLQDLEEKLLPFAIDPDRKANLLAAFHATTTMSTSKIEAAANMLNIIAQHIINAEVIYVYDMDSIEKAKHYIHQHFKESLSIGAIAEF